MLCLLKKLKFMEEDYEEIYHWISAISKHNAHLDYQIKELHNKIERCENHINVMRVYVNETSIPISFPCKESYNIQELENIIEEKEEESLLYGIVPTHKCIATIDDQKINFYINLYKNCAPIDFVIKKNIYYKNNKYKQQIRGEILWEYLYKVLAYYIEINETTVTFRSCISINKRFTCSINTIAIHSSYIWEYILEYLQQYVNVYVNEIIFKNEYDTFYNIGSTTI